jgi:hypothetical protein
MPAANSAFRFVASDAEKRAGRNHYRRGARQRYEVIADHDGRRTSPLTRRICRNVRIEYQLGIKNDSGKNSR